MKSVRVFALPLVLPVVLYVVLRPENYGLTPNSIDPLYYTGYAINLDDMLHAAGLGRYFVTRWTMYLPAHVLTLIFGPFGGRLMLRLLLAAAILTALWRLGRRWKWNIHQELLAGVVLLTMPMFVRAFFTDYFEYAVAAYGLLLVAVSLRVRQSAWSASAMGVLLAVVMIANPFSVVMAAAPICTALWFGVSSWRERWRMVAWVVGSFVAVVLFGLLYFRWGYGLDNIYRPTFEFLGNAPRDPLSATRLLWLGRYTWIYAPPIAVLAYVGIARIRRVRLDRTERLLIGMVAFQYFAHVVDQMTRGDGLEISYYWSGMYPVFGMLLAVGLAKAARGARPVLVYGAIVLWLAFLIRGVPHRLRLPHAVWFVLVVLVVLALAVAIARWSVFGGALVAVALIGWTHMGPPPYHPQSYGDLDTSPRYDLLFRQGPYGREDFYENGVWFVEQMDRVPNDADAWFVSADVLSGLYFFLYGIAVSHRGLSGDADITEAMMSMRAESSSDGPITVALLGPPAMMPDLVERWSSALPAATTVLDTTGGVADGLRLVVLTWGQASS